MKKKIIMILVAIFVFIPFINVKALELTQEMFDSVMNAGENTKIGNITHTYDGSFVLDPDDYILGEDITVHNITFNGGESTLNLNNKTLSSIIITEGAKLTIEGDGVAQDLGVFSGDFDGNIPSEVIIKGGTFANIDVTYSKLIIENVTIEGEYHGIAIGSGSDVEINGGVFNVGPEGKAFEVGTHYSENAKVVVRGGTFSGGEYGLYATLESYNQLSLLGGTYQGSIAAINVKSLEATNDEILKTSINDLLSEGYTYSPQMTFTTEYNAGQWMAKSNQKELSVVPISNDNKTDTETASAEQSIDQTNPSVNTNSNTTSNPQTIDNIVFYISMFGLSIIGLAGVGIYLKKKKSN